MLNDMLQNVANQGAAWLIGVALAFAAVQLQRRTGITITDEQKASIQNAAQNAAGRIIAKLPADQAASAIFTASSDMVQAEVGNVLSKVAGSATALNLGPSHIADMIAGKLGILQASAAGGVAQATTIRRAG